MLKISRSLFSVFRRSFVLSLNMDCRSMHSPTSLALLRNKDMTHTINSGKRKLLIFFCNILENFIVCNIIMLTVTVIPFNIITNCNRFIILLFVCFERNYFLVSKQFERLWING